MDLNCIERMGKELKCPICLDLIKATVSLSCNHIFCNDCIVRSMKSCPNCPVCKVPFHRREIRFAPNIDNLVSIYHTMKSSFVANIQSYSPDETKGKQEFPNNIPDSTQPCSQPAFPTKKRVQVPLHYDNEFPQDPDKRPKSPVLSPFFWLREEEEQQQENSSQSSEEHLLTNSPPYIPSFSELLGYACDSNSPNAKPNLVNPQCDMSFDSETIQCTQNCNSPSKSPPCLTQKRKNNPESSLKKCSNKIPKTGTKEEPICETHKPSNGTNQKDNTESFSCCFCHTSEVTRLSGEMVHYCKGSAVSSDFKTHLSVFHCHKNCAEWAPNVFFKEDKIMNLEREIIRSKRIKCGICGQKGAALGCFEKSCTKSFHFPCAKSSPKCFFDYVNFVMHCPIHSSLQLPNKNPKKPVLCCSALPADQIKEVQDFVSLTKATILKKWDSRVTHVIAFPDEHGTCRRTLKVLMGILEGKWILSNEWIKDCLKAKTVVPEDRYEIGDVNGIRNGPRRGRERVENQEPKILAGCRFYLLGEFAPFYKSYLTELIVAGGGTVLGRKPARNSAAGSYVVYFVERSDDGAVLSPSRKDAVLLADAVGATPVSNMWVLDSIAASKLQR